MSAPAITATRILLLEDESAIAETLMYALRTEGFAVQHVLLARDALALLASDPPDLAILDVGVPDGSGLDVCRAIRRRSSLPVMFLTARSDEIDRILGLELGADDYVTKPFSPREVCARVRAILRRFEAAREQAQQQARSQAPEQAADPHTGQPFAPPPGHPHAHPGATANVPPAHAALPQPTAASAGGAPAHVGAAPAGAWPAHRSPASVHPAIAQPPTAHTPNATPSEGWHLDEAARRISHHGRALALTRYEYQLLATLLKQPGRIYSRAQLMDIVWAQALDTSERTVDAHVKLLRAKLREHGLDADWIETHRNMGYSLRNS